MKAVVFDAFGTLFRVTGGGSARTILNHILASGKNVGEKAFREEWRSYYKEHTGCGSAFRTEREIFISRVKMFYDRYDVKRDAVKDVERLLEGAFERECYPETVCMLDRLRKGFPVFIASNTDNDVLESVMRKNGVKADKVYTSEDLKCYKPDRRFFEAILADSGFAPQDILFVGDSVSDDILGPKALGIRTVWIDRDGLGGDHGQDYTIRDLRELPAVCGMEA